jgi:nucleoid-associated protein YgaU
MIRVLAIVISVGLLMATGVAGASPADLVRLPITGPSSSEGGPGTESVVVAKGDHLWKISARHLGDEATDDQIAPYWRDMIEVNTPHLRSGDPDLIYPGEVVELPAIREQQ